MKQFRFYGFDKTTVVRLQRDKIDSPAQSLFQFCTDIFDMNDFGKTVAAAPVETGTIDFVGDIDITETIGIITCI